MKIAIVQNSPVFNNLEQSVVKFKALAEEAKGQQADLVVFGENWLCGYPAWIDYCPGAGLWDNPSVKQVWAEMYANSIDIKSSQFQEILSATKDLALNIVIGANEKIETGPGNGTLFNTVFTINNQGQLMNHHRKLVPTYTEKLVHGLGDGHGLNAVDLSCGRVGALICWEHWMPLTRQAMHDEGEDIHIALWPYVKEMHQIASRQYAFEGRCFVVSVGQMLHVDQTPSGLELPDHLSRGSDQWVLKGGSCIVNPDGSFLLEPQYDIDGIIYQEIADIKSFTGDKMNLAVSGHYNRPDVFELDVNRKRYF